MDLRGTLTHALRYYGEPADVARRRAEPRPRRLVLLLDVSGSMRPYSRMALQYAHVVAHAGRPVETFVFATRLTRITAQLRHRDPDTALAAAADAVVDWSGGTRLGDALVTMHQRHHRHVGLGADVVIVSDGWDRGDAALVAEGVARLRHRSHRLIWANPHAAGDGFEPLTRTLIAALPHTDRLVGAATLRSLERLGDALADGDRW